MGIPWPSKFPPEVFPITLSVPWGISVVPIPHIPLPRKIYTRVCKPIYLTDKADAKAASDKVFVEKCYQLVLNNMQEELDKLIQESIYK